MELGESAEETARREVKEETGINVGQPSLIAVDSGKGTFVKLPNGDEFYRVTVAYVATVFEGRPQTDGVESREVGFFGVHDLPNPMNGYFQEAIRRAVSALSSS